MDTSHKLQGGSAVNVIINLADRLMGRARHFQTLGRDYDAQQILSRLTRFRHLAPHIAEEAQTRLAEFYLDRCKFRKARRHLTAALVHRPQSARHQYLMAAALAGGDD